MKKIVSTILLTIIVSISLSTIAYAQEGSKAKGSKITIDQFGDIFGGTAGDAKEDKGLTKVHQSAAEEVNRNIKYVSNLPNDDHRNVISEVVKKMLFVAGILATASVIAAAVYYLISMGNEDDIGKAKTILQYTLIGLVIISGAYALTVGITKIVIF